jgi:hypothetical protein
MLGTTIIAIYNDFCDFNLAGTLGYVWGIQNTSHCGRYKAVWLINDAL